MIASDRLIEATRGLLWEWGYEGTSPKDIQKRSGVGQGSMYHHFAGKQELACAAIERTVDDLLHGIDEQFSGPGSALQRLERYVARDRDVLRGCAIGRLTSELSIVGNDLLRRPVERFFTELRKRISSLVLEGQQAQDLRAGLDPDTLACTLIAILQGGYVMARAGQSVEPYAKAVDGARLLLASFRASRSGE